MKLQKIVSRLQELHPKKIDLSLDRIQNLCKKLGNPQDKIKAISIVGTNGKYSTIQAMFSILKEANYNCNIYTSPHIKSINERFVFNNEELNDEDLANLLEEIEEANNGEPITFFEILTAAYFLKASQYPDNINLIESGLFFRFDATNILKNNLASIVTSIGLDLLFDIVFLIFSLILLALCFATIIFEFKRLDVFSKIIFSTVCSFSGSQSK